jgi:methyl-accepting chemotaxis protein
VKGVTNVKTIQFKLTVTILVIFLLSLGTLGGLNYWKAREIITDYMSLDMQQKAVSSAATTGDWLHAHSMELAIIASNPIVSNGNSESIIPVLAAAKKADNEYDAIAYADAAGNSVNEAGARLI